MNDDEPDSSDDPNETTMTDSITDSTTDRSAGPGLSTEPDDDLLDTRTARLPWRKLHTRGQIADAIVELYERKGSSRYDEAVTQLEHGAQCGQQAMEASAPLTAVVAAFLHDIGHLLVDEHDGRRDFLDRDLRHEEVGARFLANWFNERITEPIRLHVPAKRYLCAVDDAYHDGLSDASVRSLVVQGGPMSPDEVARFESFPGHDTAIDLRRWDDLAKVAGAPTASLDSYRDLIEACIDESRFDERS